MSSRLIPFAVSVFIAMCTARAGAEPPKPAPTPGAEAPALGYPISSEDEISTYPKPEMPKEEVKAATPTLPRLDSPDGPEEANVKKIKEKYWARGNEAEVRVVQNRQFSKRQKIEASATYGGLNGDPFLNTRVLTLGLGYHFTEFLSVHAIYGHAYVQNQLSTANTNEPKYYAAGETRFSLLYGKGSLVGKTILYFDAYVSLGMGYIKTESGGNFLLLAGLGQQVHIARNFGIDVSYKLLGYRETILGKTGANLGQNLGGHTNIANLLSVGISIILDPMPDSKPHQEGSEGPK